MPSDPRRSWQVRAHPGRFVRVVIPATLEATIRRVAARLQSPFFLSFSDNVTTLIALEEEWGRESSFLPGARAEGGFRLLLLDPSQEANTVESLRLYQEWVRSCLAGLKAEYMWLSSFQRDYLLVREEDLPLALEALEATVRRSATGQ